MIALLATRCGCQQKITVSYPPPPRIVLPLHASGEFATVNFDLDDTFAPKARTPASPVQTREFRLNSSPRGAYDPTSVAYYGEV